MIFFKESFPQYIKLHWLVSIPKPFFARNMTQHCLQPLVKLVYTFCCDFYEYSEYMHYTPFMRTFITHSHPSEEETKIANVNRPLGLCNWGLGLRCRQWKFGVRSSLHFVLSYVMPA
jgi:hypothetical protein